ncbi:MAG: diaminopimelate decarboxylase [Pseudomonadota bacterium]
MKIYTPSLATAKNIADKFSTPVLVTDKNSLFHRVKIFKDAFKWQKTKIFYAIKANYTPAIVKTLKNAGVDGIDAVSPWEIEMAKMVGFTSSEIIFTGNNSSDEEMEFAHKEGVLLNIGSISELKRFGERFGGSNISLRINPGVGDGENKGVITAGDESKFGIDRMNFDDAKDLVKRHNLTVLGIHCHIGSGFYNTKTFSEAVKIIAAVAKAFSNLDFLDFGGGFGVRYHPDNPPINLSDFYESIKGTIEEFSKLNGKEIEIRFEPGKFLVAESTALIVKVTNVKKSGAKTFIGVNSGFNHLIRPAFYDAYHHIINLSNPDEKKIRADIVGNICESCDVLGKDIEISIPREGDLLAILTSGAYTNSMSSLYNLRPYACEVMVDGDSIKQIKRRMTFDEMINNLGFVV